MVQKTITRVHDFKLPTAILGASLLGNDNELAVACMDGVYRVDVAAKSHQRIGEHASYVSSVAYHPASKAIVTAGYDGRLKWFSAENHSVVREEKVHRFWSWDMAISPDQQWIASVTGQYIAGDYKYTPAAETEPSVKILRAEDGKSVHSLSHVPSVQAVAFSADSQWLAAGNLMGEVRVWSVKSGEQVGVFQSKDFTSWGIIKSHCYLGGIFGIRFSPDGNELIICGMGDMRDPMAGNGRQLWQRWNWREGKMVGQTKEKQSGEGLMEALVMHPSGESFLMGGRLRGGEWNAALFDFASGQRLGTIKSGYRITEMLFNSKGELLVFGGQGQPGKEADGKFPNYGRFEMYRILDA
jgi:WD40 repeat protein